MRVRSIFAGLATTAVVASSATLVAGAAHADPGNTPGDTAWVPDANDLVGVGSDTTENLMDFLADGGDATHTSGFSGYNHGLTAAAVRVASFDTVGSATVVLRNGTTAITRPVGSGAGKALLYGAGNNTDVTFARSSSALNATEISNNLEAFPFALDFLKMAVSGSATNAPATLTGDQILDIYKGNTTNWSTVGGTAGTIKPYVPQSGSGTFNFFMAQLQLLNGGTPVTLGGDVDNTMHENTDDVIKDDPNAIAPFSVAKRTLLYPTTVHLESGWSAERAVYNVVRGADLADGTLGPELQAVFGEDGFICSTAARSLIEAAGFKQLATPAHGGACGAATQSPTSNFTENQQVATTTAISASSKTAGKVTLKATITGSTAPSGTVDFYEGATLRQAGVPLVSGQATYTATGTPGSHSYTANFVPDAGSQFDPSTATKSVTVKTSSKLTESFPSKVKKGSRAKGTVTVTLAGISSKATSQVKVMQGSKTLAKGSLSKGKVTLTLPKLSKGKHSLKATWGGDSRALGSSRKFTVTQK